MKEYFFNGGTNYTLKEKVYPKICNGCVKAKPLNKGLMPLSCYVITHAVDHTCDGPLEIFVEVGVYHILMIN